MFLLFFIEESLRNKIDDEIRGLRNRVHHLLDERKLKCDFMLGFSERQIFPDDKLVYFFQFSKKYCSSKSFNLVILYIVSPLLGLENYWTCWNYRKFDFFRRGPEKGCWKSRSTESTRIDWLHLILYKFRGYPSEINLIVQ